MHATDNRFAADDVLDGGDDAATAATTGGATAVIANRYEVELDHPLGTGGMAIVYRGRDLRTRRRVALKTLRLEYRSNPETRARFRNEIRRMAFLDHPNIARVYDLHDEGDTEWAIMEFVPGRSVKAIVAERGALPPEEAAHLLDQTAAALAHIHGHGLVHLDVKPQNLLVTEDGVVKLIDFGLTQPAGTGQELIAGLTFGTAAYLAPEQAAGETVEAATDVYALGCVLYELLTGRPPFVGGDPTGPDGSQEAKHAIIRAHLETPPVAPSHLRPDLRLSGAIDDVLLWALAKSPGDRFSDVRQFAALYRSALDINGAADRTTMPLGLDEVPWGAAPQAAPARPHRSGPAPEQTVIVAQGHAPRPVGARIYRVGGKAARRTGWLRRSLWKLTGWLALANLLLALAILATDGPDGLLPGNANRLHAGGAAEVIVDELLLRTAPGTSQPIVGVVFAGDRLEITGGSDQAEGMAWWPVEIENDGGELSGYVWAGGIAPSDDPDGLFDRLVEGVRRET